MLALLKDKKLVGKIFEFEEQSAGNPLVFSISDNAEVIFDFDNSLISENLFISDHLKKHKKPETEEEFGYYLAGLIEGDGYIGGRRIEIAFHIDDVSSAYYFDIYHLLNASKWINYIKWRKAYRIIQRKEHLTVDGLISLKFVNFRKTSETNMPNSQYFAQLKKKLLYGRCWDEDIVQSI
jgi:hypothetical protein